MMLYPPIETKNGLQDGFHEVKNHKSSHSSKIKIKKIKIKKNITSQVLESQGS